jgi:S1-C subfamily serine protease
MRTIFASLMAGAVGATIAAFVVLAVDDGGTTVIEPATQIATSDVTGVVDQAPTRQPLAADPTELDGGTVVAPQGALDIAPVFSAFGDFDPSQIFLDVGPSVVSISTGFGGGTGFFVDDLGHIVTNYHVVQGADNVTVFNDDGGSAPAELLGFDRANDLAVLLVDPNVIPAVPVTLADSDLAIVGEPVAAIGDPFGLQTSLTVGVVSAIERTRPGLDVGGRPQRGLIQTDTAINPGNSGGVLLNADGHVIGVTASVESPVRGSVGVGFAIASNTVTRFLPDMLAGREVLHPWIGINGVFDTDTAGLGVDSVVPNTPAELAGLRGGDRLITLDGVTLTDFEQLASILDERDVGDDVLFEVERGGDTIDITVTLGAWPG